MKRFKYKIKFFFQFVWRTLVLFKATVETLACVFYHLGMISSATPGDLLAASRIVQASVCLGTLSVVFFHNYTKLANQIFFVLLGSEV